MASGEFNIAVYLGEMSGGLCALDFDADEDLTSFLAVNAALAANANYTISFTGSSLTITPATLTVTADAKNKVYGQADPALTYVAVGFQFTDNAASVLTGALARNAGEAVGGYTITQGALTANANYTISFTGSTLTITPAPLTITANNRSKTYGQTVTFDEATPSPDFSVSGLVNSAIVTSVTLSSPGAAATTTVAGSPYPITPSAAVGIGLGNYTIGYSNGTLTAIPAGPAPLTITANNTNKVYGAPMPALTASYDGFVNGEGPADRDIPATLSTTATSNSIVGSYPITVSGAEDTNYSITFVPGTLTITRASTIGTLISSANPELPGVDVSFTFTASVAPPGFGTPIGPVRFRLDGVNLGQLNLSGGTTELFIFGGLPAGFHTITAEYLGSTNFLGVTNTLLQLANTPPRRWFGNDCTLAHQRIEDAGCDPAGQRFGCRRRCHHVRFP